MTRDELNPLVNLDVNNSIAAEHVCPRCGHNNKLHWQNDGHLEWWPTAYTCVHFTGAYSTGMPTTVALYYR